MSKEKKRSKKEAVPLPVSIFKCVCFSVYIKNLFGLIVY